MALMVMSQVAYATGYYIERARARRAKADRLGASTRADESSFRPELLDAPELVTAEPQPQPRPLRSA